MHKLRFSDATWWKIIFVLFAAIVSINAFGSGLGELEGRLWPVKNHAKLNNLREGPNGVVIFDGYAEKHRDCELVDIRWYYISPRSGSHRELDLVSRDRPAFTGVGMFVFRDWELYISPTDLIQHTRAYAYHYCHGLFPTISVFYEGGDQAPLPPARIEGRGLEGRAPASSDPNSPMLWTGGWRERGRL